MRLATQNDVPTLVNLRAEASRWLANIGIDQWAHHWPDTDTMLENIRRSITAGETWCVDHDGRVIATIALDHSVRPGLWTTDELTEPARYAHRLIVTRDYSGTGLGAELLDWAGSQAAHAGATWLRIDVWTDNNALQRYYQQLGFKHVRTIVRDDDPSGALFQRPCEQRLTPRLTHDHA